jgi:presenilin-like A22 family membrane protease
LPILTIFGLAAVTAGLLFYVMETWSSWFILAFAIACGMSAIYGLLMGAWPLAISEFFYTLVAVQRWQTRHRRPKRLKHFPD